MVSFFGGAVGGWGWGRPALAALLGVLWGAGSFIVQAGPGAPLAGAGIRAAAHYSEQHEALALLVFQNGRLRWEWYAPETSPDEPQKLASCVKTLWGMAAAAAVHDRLISWDEPVSATLPEWQTDPLKARITIRDLLSMTSGLAPGFGELYQESPPDLQIAAAALPASAAAGTQFTYGPANMEVFGLVLSRKLAARKMTPRRYLERRLLRPLGVRVEDWRHDEAGHPWMSSGARMTARGLLRLGRLLLQDGRWRRRALLPRGALAPLTVPGRVNPAYGLTLWLNRQAALSDSVEVDVEKVLSGQADPVAWEKSCFSHAAPPDLFLMLGSYNQRVYVVPSRQLVVVRQGKGTSFEDAVFLGLLFGEPPQEMKKGPAAAGPLGKKAD